MGGCETMSQEINRRSSRLSKTGIYWYEPASILPETAFEFCQETTLHGVKYICQPKRHLSERIFWLLTLVAGGVAAGLLIRNLWKEYLHKPIVTFSPYETTISEIPFPAITICNSNILRRSKLERLMNVTRRYLDAADADERLKIENEEMWSKFYTNIFHALELCENKKFGQSIDFSSSPHRRHKQNLINQLRNLTLDMKSDPNITDTIWSTLDWLSPHDCGDMIKECRLNGEEVICEKLFDYDFVRGQLCCSFNSVPAIVYNSTKEWWRKRREMFVNGTAGNLTDSEKRSIYWFNDLETKDALLLPSASDAKNAVKPGEVENINNWYTPKRQRTSGKSNGLSIVLNPELKEYTCTLTQSDGLLLQVHPATSIQTVKEAGVTIKPNSEVLVEVTPGVTKANENLKYIPIEHRNCYFQEEKYLSTSWYYTMDICIDECIDNLTKLSCNCTYLRQLDPIFCKEDEIDCTHEFIKNITRSDYAKMCNCFPLCTTVKYLTRVSSAVIDRGSKTDEQKLSTVDDNETNITTNDLSVVHIYFVEDFVYAIERKKLYGIVDLIANAGGILGLCLGFSALSFLECVYFLTFRRWCQNRRRKTIFDIISTNMTRLLERKQESRDVPENRRVMFALKLLHDEALEEMLPTQELGNENENIAMLVNTTVQPVE